MTKKGLLVEGSVTNLLTANQASFEDSSVAQVGVRYCSHEQSDAWSKHGEHSQKVIRGDDLTADAYMWYRCDIAEMGFEVETPFIAQATVYLPPGCWYIGRDMTFRVRFAGGGQGESTLTTKTFTLREGENLLWVVDELDYADRKWVEYFIWEAGVEHRAPAGTVYYTDCHMAEVGAKIKKE